MTAKNNGGEKAKPRGKPFEPGHPGGPGRPAGVPNKATAEIKAYFRGVLESAEYRASLEQRAKAGELAPAIEALAYHYAYGKPADRVEMTGDVAVSGTYDISQAPNEVLLALKELLARIPRTTPEP